MCNYLLLLNVFLHQIFFGSGCPKFEKDEAQQQNWKRNCCCVGAAGLCDLALSSSQLGISLIW
jgi:hypothetical protein